MKREKKRGFLFKNAPPSFIITALDRQNMLTGV